MLVGLIFLTTYGNTYQKTSRRVPPAVMDLLFGVLLGLPVFASAIAFGAPITPELVGLSVAFGLQSVLLNAYCGNLKDLAYDLPSGWRTTAITLGVRVASDGYFTFSWPYRAYLLAPQIISVFALGLVVAGVASGSRGALSWVGPAAVVVLSVVATASVFSRLWPSAAFRRRIQELDSGSRSYTRSISRPPFIFLNVASFVLAAALLSGRWAELMLFSLLAIVPAIPFAIWRRRRTPLGVLSAK